ncbi:hypothetical protein [Agrobacterium sp. SUL3]|uniref:hypothetical protein n=1 Tax=Agrobacterium sp. SUL3 TaxID=1701910 RepID=UPI0018D04CE1|nr:hypothetical protein [Agrobacterium sp. SUL3]
MIGFKTTEGRVLALHRTLAETTLWFEPPAPPEMDGVRLSVENTVKNANGQLVQRTLKNKELRMTAQQLEVLIRQLLVQQENKCALTGIPFQFQGQHDDNNLLPSLDRKDSNGHYEEGNLQVVCQFINFWKGDADNEEFRRLLNVVRGIDD